MTQVTAERIRQLKQKTDTVVLAHTYQSPDIIAVADITGDSFALAKAAVALSQKKVILCGVRFMAESVKILAPEKTVILPAPDAGCAMANMITAEQVLAWKREYPGAAVCAYINTRASVKAVCDVTVTSSCALRVLAGLPQKDILFLPDRNLGAFLAKSLPEKNIICWDGCCPVHDALTEEDVLNAKKEHPGALLALHPECRDEVLRCADTVGSTADILRFALSADKPVIIGTERGVADTLIPAHPEKTFYRLCPEKLVCPDMKKISAEVLVSALQGEAGEEITLPETIRMAAKKAMDKMLELG